MNININEFINIYKSQTYNLAMKNWESFNKGELSGFSLLI